MRLRFWLSLMFLALMGPSYLLLAELMDEEDPVSLGGATTPGGVVPGARIIHVTSLKDDGPGTLRDAIAYAGPRVIVFDIGGLIHLQSDLKVATPYITIAGQTSPDPGVTLTGGSLRVRSHDVVIQHISVLPGPGDTPQENDNRDAFSIDGSPSDENRHSFNVRLENVTAGWSVDEAVSLWYPTTRAVTVTNSIVGEALSNAGHPKGPHSMGLLVGYGITGVEITGNILVSNSFRNPAIVQGAQVFVANNFIYNPGQNAIHFYPRDGDDNTKVSLINNVIFRGPDTKRKIVGILIPSKLRFRPHDSIYVSGNLFSLGAEGTEMGVPIDLTTAKVSPIEVRDWSMRQSHEVRAMALRYAGSRPLRRSVNDQRIIESIRKGSSRIIDEPAWTESAPSTARTAMVPHNPFGLTASGETRLAQWLCLQHLEVGGAPSGRCH